MPEEVFTLIRNNKKIAKNYTILFKNKSSSIKFQYLYNINRHRKYAKEVNKWQIFLREWKKNTY